jgi:putative ABC transport system ATP-binding protein
MSSPVPSAAATTTAAATTAATTTAAITASQVSRRYGDGPTAVDALRGVSVSVPAGSFTAVMGPSGSGKSTLLHCLSGLDSPTGGRVFLGETEITGMKERELTRLRRDRVGFVFQAFNLLPTLTARENILLPLQLAGGRPDVARLEQITGLLGLADRLGHSPGELSGGQIQRVAVARALITQPQVIFADEPTGNLDRRACGELLHMLRRCVNELGQTVVTVTHDPLVATYADRVLFLADGQIAGELTDTRLPAILARLDALDGAAAPDSAEGLGGAEAPDGAEVKR